MLEANATKNSMQFKKEEKKNEIIVLCCKKVMIIILMTIISSSPYQCNGLAGVWNAVRLVACAPYLAWRQRSHFHGLNSALVQNYFLDPVWMIYVGLPLKH